MKLLVHVIKARDLPAVDINGSSDPYVRLQLGKHRAKTKIVKNSLNPVWDEEFSFGVGDLNEELTISVVDGDILGQVKVPMLKVLDADGLSLGTQWYQLQPKSKKAKIKFSGEICLTISFSHNDSCTNETPKVYHSCSDDLTSSSDKSFELTRDPPLPSSNVQMESSSVSVVEESEFPEDKSDAPSFVHRLFQYISGRNIDVASTSSNDIDIKEDKQETTVTPEVSENQDGDASSKMTFEELLKVMESKDQGGEIPENLPGGVLIDQSYVASPGELNSLLFSPTSNFLQSLADLQGTTGLETGPWRPEYDGGSLKRVITYIKAASKLVKAVKATDEQTYLKADGNTYAVLSSASTPDVPFGKCFKTEVLTCILPGPDLPSEEPSSRLVISWRMNFIESTWMKGMIENGAREGLKDSFSQYAYLISQNVKPVDLKDTGSSKEQILASLETEQESDWKLAVRFFGNFTVISSVIVGLYVMVHILLTEPSKIQGLEFRGLDLPDSIGEVVVCGVLVLQGERFLGMVGRYLQARKQRGCDHGVKAQGDGWLLTVALIEGSNLAAVDSSGYSDPYVVFTCNGKTKTSSIKFQTPNPQWNEIFEFDAMDDPPSMMNVNVYDFDGPFDEAVSLGHAEVNFLKSNISELADIWIPLQGKLAQACQSKLRLRVFLDNTRGTKVVTEYLTKVEKEVGTKINMRSLQTNSTFQKIFSLPPEEFLINDFTCQLKRKMSLQGRLFLSPRIIGFYANFFGQKTKFFFLWEDIEDIQVAPPSFLGSPGLLIILRRGRGLDAKHGAKSLDQDGRLKFHFQSFVSFSVANRTIMALWKARSPSPEQKVQIVEGESEEKTFQSEDSGSFLGIEDAKMSEVFSSTVPVPINSLMELFEGNSLERRVMGKMGSFDYSVTPWEAVKPDVWQRKIHYKFDKTTSGSGKEVTKEVTGTQQKFPLVDSRGWVIEEVMTLQGVLLCDHFSLRIRYCIEDPSRKFKACSVQVSMGIAWLKSTNNQKRITKNVLSYSTHRFKEIFHHLEKEFSTGK